MFGEFSISSRYCFTRSVSSGAGTAVRTHRIMSSLYTYKTYVNKTRDVPYNVRQSRYLTTDVPHNIYILFIYYLFI